MRLILSLQGDFTTEVEASDLGIDDNTVTNAVSPDNSDVELSDVTIRSGTVEVEGTARVTGIEVEAADMENFDADEALGSAISPYGGVDVSNTERTIDEGPTGWDDVVAAVGYDEDIAMAVFAILDRNGYSD